MCNCVSNPSVPRRSSSPSLPRVTWAVYAAGGMKLSGGFREESGAERKLAKLCADAHLDGDCTYYVDQVAA